MKYGKIYVTAALFLCAGLIVFVIGFAMMGFNVMNFDTEPAYVQRSYSLDGNVSSISVCEENANVNVVLSKDKKINLKYYENGEKTYTISKLADGSICIKKDNAGNFINNFFAFSVSTPILTIEIPEKYAGKLLIENRDGNIAVEGIRMGSLSAETDNGYVRIYESSFSGNVDVETEDGNIELYQVKVDGTAKIAADNGRLFSQSVTASELYMEADNGFMTLVDTSASGSIFAESDNCDIEISSISFENAITLIAENGDIKGSVIGSETDFAFNCVATNGTSNLENIISNGRKQLNLRTENGDIEINFISTASPQE